ncbi:MAG: hypothetical protein O9312_13065 [Hylemonella sp.]|nr:hypothetical protein [Hylemonella sp.]
MSKKVYQGDPRGHSVRVYSEIYDSPAFGALSPHDVLAYLALLRVLKGYNNGDLSLPLSRAQKCGISHPKTLARSLRALCAVGLVALARRGGATRGGQRLPSLYRMTDRECFEIPAKFLEAKRETNEWKLVTSVEHGRQLIEAAEAAAKLEYQEKKNLGHPVKPTSSPDALVKAKTMALDDVWRAPSGHQVNLVRSAGNPVPTRISKVFEANDENANHRALGNTPIYLYQPRALADCINLHGRYLKLTRKPAYLFSRLGNETPCP